MKHIQLSLEEAEALAQEIRQRPASGDEHRRPDVLRREDAIVVLWQALVDERKRADERLRKQG